MSDFNPLVRKSIPVHRSGFDMSEKKDVYRQGW